LSIVWLKSGLGEWNGIIDTVGKTKLVFFIIYQNMNSVARLFFKTKIELLVHSEKYEDF